MYTFTGSLSDIALSIDFFFVAIIYFFYFFLILTTKATANVVRAGKDAENERNENIDKNINKRSFRKKSERNEEKVGKLSKKQEKLREKKIGIYPNSYQRRHRRRQEKRTENLDNPVQGVLSQAIDAAFDGNTGSSSMNESPGGEVNSPLPSTPKVNKQSVKNDEAAKMNDDARSAVISKILASGVSITDPQFQPLVDKEMEAYTGMADKLSDMLNPGINDEYKFLHNDPYNIKKSMNLDPDTEGDALSSAGSGNPGQTINNKMKSGTPSGSKAPSVDKDLNINDILGKMKNSGGLAIEKLGLSDYYPQAGRSVGVGTFTGSRIGSQTIYSGAGVLAPIGILDARKRALQSQTRDKMAALDGIKNSLGTAAAQFDQQFTEEGMNMINSYISKYKGSPMDIMNDTEFRKKLKQYNSFAEGSKEITKLVEGAISKSQPDKDGNVAAVYSPAQLKEMNDFLTNANDPDFMRDVLSGKINISDIRNSIKGKINLIDKIDGEWSKMTTSTMQSERPYNFDLKGDLSEDELKQAQGWIQELKTGTKNTSDLFRSGSMKYFEWTDESRVEAMIESLAKGNGVDLNDKHSKGYLENAKSYVMAKIPGTRIEMANTKIGNMTKSEYDAYQRKKLEKLKHKNKMEQKTDYNSYNLALDHGKEGAGSYSDPVPGAKFEDNIDKTVVTCYGYINGDKSTLGHYSLQELSEANTKSGGKINQFQSEKHSSIEGANPEAYTQYIDYTKGNPFKGPNIERSMTYKRNMLHTKVHEHDNDSYTEQNYSGTVITYVDGEEVESNLIFSDKNSRVINNGVKNRGAVQNVNSRGTGTYRADNATLKRL